MKIEQIYTGCLAHGAYYIESNGEAAIVDPLSESDAYIKRAERDGAKVKYIFETHFHADFVSGHLDLARKTGAKIIYGQGAVADFMLHAAQDGEVFELGDIKIIALHTPGHTLESATFLLKDENGKDHCIFSGDTLFIGDVGRPDLAVSSKISKEDLAGMLYDSLHNKVMNLPDDVIVYPGHGAGSACGKNMSDETIDTLGHQKKVNYALRPGLSREQFIAEVTAGQIPPPQYFFKNAMINKKGYESMDHILRRGTVALGVEAFDAIASREDTLILDTRTASEYMEGHIPGSVFIGVDGNFAPWVGALITDINQAIVFVATPGREQEVVTRLSRVGYDNSLGYLEGGIAAWKNAGKKTLATQSITPAEFKIVVEDGDNKILDVRRPNEFDAGHIEAAMNLPLDEINERMDELDRKVQYYVYCAGGYRSTIFISILESRGFMNLVNVPAGFAVLQKEGIRVMSELHI
jgi:glyoxylase-like metal-dependent hydrolase (beta-lactamase superfamily II)/rhodanese-related sulfurtransferase